MAKAKLKKVTRKRREKKLVERGAAHIRSSFNNTIVTITDPAGNARELVFFWRTEFPRQQRSPRLSRRRWRLRPLPRPRWSSV